MKNSFCVLLFFITGVSKVMSQTADITYSYILREIQIVLAEEYNKELSRSLPKFTEYVLENTFFYQATKIGETRRSSFSFTFPIDPCGNTIYLNPLKKTRCEKKIAFLRLTDELVKSIPLTNTNYNPETAVKNRITVKVSSILRDINKELLNN
ncbi:hypothetical protein [Flavobacterium sp. LAR06]|uniref:hypothetical protein n=1 Tax=Flavobacterium sp. LAR06 TaxID=3064897 RepID=UPI0035C0B2B3